MAFKRIIAYPIDDKYIDWSNPKTDISGEIPHPHDKKFMEEQLRALPYALKPKAKAGYIAVYEETHSKEPIEHKKSNAARNAANNRLRLFVANVTKAC